MNALVPVVGAFVAFLLFSGGSSGSTLPGSRKPAAPPPPPKDKAPAFKPPSSDVVSIPVPGLEEGPVSIDVPPAFESWKLARPEDWSQSPTLSTDFKVGDDAFLVLQSPTSAVVARMLVLSVKDSEAAGPVAAGVLKMLRPTAAFEQLSGTSQPALGSKVEGLPIAYAVRPPSV